MTDVTVNTKDLRQALAAVVAHASVDPEQPTFHRIRLAVDAVNVQVFATQGFTTGLSIVSVVDHGDGEAGQWDMPPSAVKDLLNLFRVSKDVEEEACLRFQVDGEHVHVQDVSGLFPGKAVVLPRLPDHDYYPDVPGVIGQALVEASGRLEQPVATAGPWWATFVAASKAYRAGMLITPSTAGGRERLLITVGESFIGQLTASADEDRLAELEQFRNAWGNRLPEAPRYVRQDPDDRHLSAIDDEDAGEED